MVSIVGIIFILLYFLIIALVIEISTILLTLTGLEKDVARFQAISMLTGTGFTTGESELVARHPLRRKLATFLILFGAFSLAVIISAISALLADRSGLIQLGVIIAVLVLIFVVMRSRKVQEHLGKRLEANMREVHLTHELPVEDVLLFGEDDMFTEVHVFRDSSLIGKGVIDCLENETDINVLLIKRGDEIVRKSLNEAKVQEGDILFVYGNRSAIEKLFKSELQHMQEIEKDENNKGLLV